VSIHKISKRYRENINREPAETGKPTTKKSGKPEEITLSIPEAGKRYFDLSRNGSYAAADRGDIPTVRIGKLRRVPVRILERRLEAAR
jgi:hypothetical protein